MHSIFYMYSIFLLIFLINLFVYCLVEDKETDKLLGVYSLNTAIFVSVFLEMHCSLLADFFFLKKNWGKRMVRFFSILCLFSHHHRVREGKAHILLGELSSRSNWFFLLLIRMRYIFECHMRWSNFMLAEYPVKKINLQSMISSFF